MNILVLGGTGAMGSYLVKILSSQGHKVTVTSRKKRENTENIQYLQGDAHSQLFLGELLQTHWDAIVDFMIYSTTEFAARKEQLLLAANQYIFLSTARVYADSIEPITEDSLRLLDVCENPEYLQTDEYALKKARQEDLLRNSAYRNWTIIRPYITFSEYRLQLGVLEKEYWLYRALHGRSIVFSKDIASKTTTMTFGNDVARGIAAIIGQRSAFGEAFHITAGESYRWNEILDIYIDTLEKRTGTRPNVFMCDKAPALETTAKYQVLYDRYYHRRFNNTKISKYIDIASFQSPVDALRNSLTRFLADPVFLGISAREQARTDRIAHEAAKLSEFISAKQKVKYIICRYLIKM